MDRISGNSEGKIWFRRILAAYVVLFMIGIAFYTGMRLNDLLTQPASTLTDVGLSALGALIVGVVFAAFGMIIAFVTFAINDLLNKTRERDQLISGYAQKYERRNRHRINYTASH